MLALGRVAYTLDWLATSLFEVAGVKTVGATEAKRRFSELLREVENGETVIVTRHGLPVARLIPMAKEADDVAAAIEEIHRYRREHRPTLGGITLRELIAEGRI
jgi:prevent-host-death family protein